MEPKKISVAHVVFYLMTMEVKKTWDTVNKLVNGFCTSRNPLIIPVEISEQM
jgi:hypothetical protein